LGTGLLLPPPVVAHCGVRELSWVHWCWEGGAATGAGEAPRNGPGPASAGLAAETDREEGRHRGWPTVKRERWWRSERRNRELTSRPR
jgi:hypothetical protein